MTSPWLMGFLLIFFGLCLGAVLSAYREDEPRAILRGTLRRAALFCGAVIGIAAVAGLVSATILSPSA